MSSNSSALVNLTRGLWQSIFGTRSANLGNGNGNTQYGKNVVYPSVEWRKTNKSLIVL